MPTFEVVATDKTGREIRRTINAPNKDAVVAQLRRQGLQPESVSEKTADTRLRRRISLRGRKVKLRDLSMFCRQFATMIGAGVPLVRCLDVLEQQTSSAGLKAIIRDIEHEIEGGATLSRAMQKHPRAFSNLAVGLVRAGEVGGVLDETLDRLATFLEKDLELRRKVKSSMTYPTLVMIFAFGIVMFLATFIIPKFIKLFRELGMKDDDFPLPTRMLVYFSDFVVKKWWLTLIVLIGLALAFNRFKATRTGRRIWDMVKLKAPVFGRLNHELSIARFARTLSTLLASGVPILQALETVAGTVDNDHISDAILQSRASIREGDTIANPLAGSRMFPPMVVQMITIGEETGQLDAMLAKVADFYEGEVDARLESLTAALEPVLIVFLGFVVGFIVISMFLPLIAIISNLSQ
ncbi:MAG: type II secretion system F family protein [Armatimonadetes bacterium]|nr:type II secretion system F family protein [Armatimonadota bacterium]